MPREVFEREEKRLAKPFRYVAQPDEEGQIEGCGAVFGDVHPTSSMRLPSDWTDIVRPGAFKKALAEHKRAGTMPAMLLQHELSALPVGAWTQAEEDDAGLKLTGKIATKTATGRDVYELLKIGALTGLSIGFTATKHKLDEKAKVREILEVDLFEISVVTVPGIDAARVTDVKRHQAKPHDIRSIETALRDAGLSRSEAKALLADGFKALDLRDAGSGTADAPQFDPSQLLAGLRALRG
jgi:HK97 family phage prohead protease